MSHIAHILLILSAVILNRGDRRMFVMTLIIGLSLVLPVNRFTTFETFYATCAAAELAIGIFAVAIRARASYFVANICAMLVTYHLIGWGFDGYPDDSPYQTLVRMCEFAAIAACVVYAKPMTQFARKNAGRIFN